MPRPPKEPLCLKECGMATRHKSGICEPCRKKEKKKCANKYCKRFAAQGELCLKHYKYMIKKEETFGIRLEGGEILDPDFDDLFY
jgi:hypothetical protein